MNLEQFEGRKRDHIRHALDPAHQAIGQAGLDRIHLIHEALPELDFDGVRVDSQCLGRSLNTPFYVAGMTAGHADAPKLNRLLAEACVARGWAMGVGSQRRDLEATGERGARDGWVELREQVPDLVLLANLGLSQIIDVPVRRIRERVTDLLGAQALAIHLNPLQEAMQPEGTPSFKGGLEAIRRVVGELGLPVIVKETGTGMSRATLERLGSLGLAAIDVSGLGGTHWGRIEGARAGGGSPIQAAAATTFANWGESTADSVISARAALRDGTEIWASGGVRSGLDAAKLIALGAHRVGYAQPALRAALEGPAKLDEWMRLQEYELRVALFCTGCAAPRDLRNKEGAWKIHSA